MDNIIRYSILGKSPKIRQVQIVVKLKAVGFQCIHSELHKQEINRF